MFIQKRCLIFLEKIGTLNKPYQQQGLEKVMYPEEQLYNKQKNLLNLYKPTEISAENVKKLVQVDHPNH